MKTAHREPWASAPKIGEFFAFRGVYQLVGQKDNRREARPVEAEWAHTTTNSCLLLVPSTTAVRKVGTSGRQEATDQTLRTELFFFLSFLLSFQHNHTVTQDLISHRGSVSSLPRTEHGHRGEIESLSSPLASSARPFFRI